MGHQTGEATNLVMMGGLYRDMGRLEDAREILTRAVAMLEALRYREIAEARRMLSEVEALARDGRGTQ